MNSDLRNKQKKNHVILTQMCFTTDFHVETTIINFKATTVTCHLSTGTGSWQKIADILWPESQ